jgi:hypothetical protein
LLRDRRERAQPDAGAREQHRRRQRQPPGQPLNQADENEEPGENEQRDRQKRDLVGDRGLL